MKKLTFLFAIFLSHTAFSLDPSAGPISKFPDSSIQEIKSFSVDKMVEAYVVFSGVMSQAELNNIAVTYNVKVFASQNLKEATIIGHFANILVLTAKPGIAKIEVGHYTDSPRVRIDYVGMGSSIPVSDFRDIGVRFTPINQSGPRTLQTLYKSRGGVPTVIGEINFIDPILSYKYGYVCSGPNDDFDSSTLQVTTNDATGKVSYHYVYVNFSSAVDLYAQRNLPVIEYNTARKCIPRQTITARELGLISFGE
jgi:hypothetical protein